MNYNTEPETEIFFVFVFELNFSPLSYILMPYLFQKHNTKHNTKHNKTDKKKGKNV